MVGADLPAPDTGLSLGWGTLAVPVRPPAGPDGVKLQLELWLAPIPSEGDGEGE